MKKILIIQYSQSGQLSDVLKNLAAPLLADPGIEVTVETLRPKKAFPFPWPFFQFFDAFPDCVYLDALELEPLQVDSSKRFDLVILGYQVWFLSPSLPVTAFLKSPAAAQLLNDTPVVTVVSCRDMWMMAQEQVKKMLAGLSAKLVGHVALVDEAGSIGSFLATPIWVITGKRGPHLFGLIPRAGVNPKEIEASSRFGQRMAEVLSTSKPLDGSLLKNLGAVRVNARLIASEKTARRSFLIWGKLLRSLGPRGSWRRKPVLVIYIIFLVTLIITFVPLSMLLKAALSPLFAKRVAEQKAYFGEPSGA